MINAHVQCTWYMYVVHTQIYTYDECGHYHIPFLIPRKENIFFVAYDLYNIYKSHNDIIQAKCCQRTPKC